MIFTVMLNIFMVFISILVILIHNQSQELMRESFSGTIENKLHSFMNSEFEVKQKYREGEIDNLMSAASIVHFFSNVMIFNTIGMITSVV